MRVKWLYDMWFSKTVFYFVLFLIFNLNIHPFLILGEIKLTPENIYSDAAKNATMTCYACIIKHYIIVAE